MSLGTFEDLKVWKRGCRLAVDVCGSLRDSKDYALKDQMTRSSISVPSNIAEGAERDSPGDFKRFLRIAKGSCAELRTQLYIYKALNPDTPNIDKWISETKEIAAMLQGLIQSIDSNRINEDPSPYQVDKDIDSDH